MKQSLDHWEPADAYTTYLLDAILTDLVLENHEGISKNRAECNICDREVSIDVLLALQHFVEGLQYGGELLPLMLGEYSPGLYG